MVGEYVGYEWRAKCNTSATPVFRFNPCCCTVTDGTRSCSLHTPMSTSGCEWIIGDQSIVVVIVWQTIQLFVATVLLKWRMGPIEKWKNTTCVTPKEEWFIILYCWNLHKCTYISAIILLVLSNPFHSHGNLQTSGNPPVLGPRPVKTVEDRWKPLLCRSSCQVKKNPVGSPSTWWF